MKKILLIEDNLELLENTSELLELAGYKVITAHEGKKGVEKAIKHLPDLIISDIMMPNLDGYGVLHLINRQPQLTGTPFIFLTAKTDRSDFRKGMDLGADDYLTKPFSETELLNAIESRLKKSSRSRMNTSLSAVGTNLEKSKKEILEELIANGNTNLYANKQTIFLEGNHPQYLFYIRSGKVKAYKTNEEGKDLTIGLYSPGDFLGYIALIEDSVYKINAQTLEESELVLISKKEFTDKILSNASYVLEFTKTLVANNNYKAEQMVQLAYNSLRKRVANTLVLLKEKFTSQKSSSQNFQIKITREELANLAGTTTESLIRTLSDFKSEELIHIHGRSIEIIDEDKLKNMYN